MWINPLDKVPQIPVDWANHIAQGGLYSSLFTTILTVILHSLGHEWRSSAQLASLIFLGFMTIMSFGKKIVDYFKAGETLQMCAGKAVVTVLWPATVAAAAWIGV